MQDGAVSESTPLRFERPAPAWMKWTAISVGVCYVVLGMGLPLVRREIAEAMPSGLPTTPLAVRLTLAGLPTLIFCGLLFFLHQMRLRYGVAEIRGQAVEFTLALVARGKQHTRDLSDVVERTVTPWGVVLRFAKSSVFERARFIVPAEEDRVHEVLEHLDRLRGAVPDEAAPAGEGPPPQDRLDSAT